MEQMITQDQLRARIREAFDAVPFPEHCGLRAAMAKDTWQSDPITLAKITAEEDIHGPWWEIPIVELRECTLALSYLDAQGTEFYLPAYMTAVLKDFADTTRLRLHVFALFDPDFGDGTYRDELNRHFRDKFSRIRGEKKKVCVDFLEFWSLHLSSSDPFSDFDVISRILRHEYWLSH